MHPTKIIFRGSTQYETERYSIIVCMNKGEDFIRRRIKEDLEKNIVSHVHTRFPPEPNGYIHIGHAKSIGLNFGIIEELNQEGIYNGVCTLRFDDTNPEKENIEYINSIKEDVKWLGGAWEDREYYASNYFQQMYEYAIVLIKKGLAYVDHSSAEEIRIMRGTPTQSGMESKYRSRDIEENILLFEQMKSGQIKAGTCLLRAKIDMAHHNIVMRDPPIYRIRDVAHHRTGTTWKIYPMYDFAHCLSDAIEGITHSLCTLEFEIHRPLYDWFIQSIGITKPHPVQIEFARLNISHTVLSKRKMKLLVDRQLVDGWDDPRMPTVAGLRRRGYTSSAIRSFCKEVGVTKTNSLIDIARLEETQRQELNKNSKRVMTVLNPIKLIIDNYPKEQVESYVAENNQENIEDGTHEIFFSNELYIERDDVMENPPKGYRRLFVGNEVRLKYAYYVVCTEIIKDNTGDIIEVHATYDPESKGGGTADGRKVKSTIHWVSCKHCIDIHVHMLDVLFLSPNPEQLGDDFINSFNNNSRAININSKSELYIQTLIKEDCSSKTPYPIQFLRKGYFMLDVAQTLEGKHPVFNHTVSLKEGWKK